MDDLRAIREALELARPETQDGSVWNAAEKQVIAEAVSRFYGGAVSPEFVADAIDRETPPLAVTTTRHAIARRSEGSGQASAEGPHR